MSLRFLTILSEAFTPKYISGLQVWVDGNDNSTITLTSGKVSQWNDKSGNGINLTQSSSTYQSTPTTNIINGLQALLFPSVGGFPANSGIAGTMSGALSAFSFGMVVQPVSLATDTALIATETNTGDISIETNGSDQTKLDAFINGVGVSGTSATGSFNTSTNYWVFVTYSTPTLTIYTSNTSILSTTTNLTGRQLAAKFSICGNTGSGGYACLHGYVGEVVIYNSALNSGDRSNLYNYYIKPKWGV
jgi:hypothetical protein